MQKKILQSYKLVSSCLFKLHLLQDCTMLIRLASASRKISFLRFSHVLSFSEILKLTEVSFTHFFLQLLYSFTQTNKLHEYSYQKILQKFSKNFFPYINQSNSLVYQNPLISELIWECLWLFYAKLAAKGISK